MWRILTFVISVVPSFAFVLCALYAYSWQIELGLLAAFIAIFPLIWSDIVLSIVEDKSAVISPAVKIVLVFISMLCLAVNGVVLFVAGWFVEIELVYPLIVWLCTIVLTIFGMKMIKRTRRGTELYGRVLGLREFIVHGEYDRLKAMVDENPELFYHVLPYAYAMNLTDVWAHHFKNLNVAAPSWYTGPGYPGNVYHMSHRLNHHFTHLQSAMISVPPVSSSSGGGSFSGGSSGGFSGGGFGGSRGGSW